MAKKSLGQNFLTDQESLLAMIHTARITKNDTVLEIGPGKGSLTTEILKSARKVIAIEKDRRLIDFLCSKFKKEIAEARLDLREGDILDIYENKQEPSCDKIVANIPYYITGHLLRLTLASEKRPRQIVLLLQKEVAERIIAKDGKESLLSISIKAYGIPKYIKTVPAEKFEPVPSIDSAVISIEQIFPRIKDENKFFSLLKKGFAHKRKLLVKNLDTTTAKMKSCEISENARAEDLSTENWLCLSDII